MRVHSLVQLPPSHPASGSDRATPRINLDLLQQCQIDHHAAVRYRLTGHVMATTTNRNLQTGLAPQPHRRYHVLGPRTANNQGGMLVHEAVMNSADLVVARISRRHHRTSESRPQILYLEHRPHTHAPPPSARAVPAIIAHLSASGIISEHWRRRRPLHSAVEILRGFDSCRLHEVAICGDVPYVRGGDQLLRS